MCEKNKFHTLVASPTNKKCIKVFYKILNSGRSSLKYFKDKKPFISSENGYNSFVAYHPILFSNYEKNSNSNSLKCSYYLKLNLII